MSCNTLLSIPKSCEGNTGGILKAWFNNGDAIDSGSVTIDGVTGVVDGADLASGAAGFVEFQFNPNTSNFTDNMVGDLTTGSTTYTQVITIQLTRREALKRQRLLLISQGQPPLTVIVKDSNSKYWIFGLNDYKVYLTANEGGSGTAKADLNGYTLTFTVEDVLPAFEIEEAVVESLMA